MSDPYSSQEAITRLHTEQAELLNALQDLLDASPLAHGPDCDCEWCCVRAQAKQLLKRYEVPRES